MRRALSRQNLQRLGSETVDELVSRVKDGFGVKNKRKNKLKRLSTGYKEQRKKLKLASSTSPGKSNLTQTGNMLDSITVKVSTAGFTIAPDSSNIAKVGYVSKERPFLDLTDKELDKLVKAISEDISKELKREFT